MTINIRQLEITEKFQIFLALLGERYPVWLSFGMCNAFNFMMMRAVFFGKEEEFYQRLENLSLKSESQINELAKIYYDFRVNVKNLDKTKLEEAKDLYSFVSMLFFAQDPGANYHYTFNNKLIKQVDVEALIDLFPCDAKLVISPNKIYSFGFNFKGQSNELAETLLKILRTNCITRICCSDHVMHITVHKTKDGPKFKLYDANNVVRPWLIPINTLVTKLKKGFFTNFGLSDAYMPIYINIYGDNNADEKPRPTPLKLYEAIIEQRKKDRDAQNLPSNTAESLGLNQTGFEGWTSLTASLTANNIEVVEKLLEYKDMAINEDIDVGRAIICGHIELVKKLKNKVKIKPENLFYACRNGDIELVKLVIAALEEDGVDINTIYDDENNSPLQFAVSKHLLEVVKVLLDEVPILSHKNKAGKTARDIAVYNRDKDLIDLLSRAELNHRPLSLNDINNYVFSNRSSDVQQKSIASNLPSELHEKNAKKKRSEVKRLFLFYKNSSHFKKILENENNIALARQLYGVKFQFKNDRYPVLAYSDSLLNYALDSLDISHRLLAPITIEKRVLFKKVFNVCLFFGAVIAGYDIKENNEFDSVFEIAKQAYKVLVLFGNQSKNIFSTTEAYLKQFYNLSSPGVLHNALVYSLPADSKPGIHLEYWQKLIRKEGPKAFLQFIYAPKLASYLAKASRGQLINLASLKYQDILDVLKNIAFESAKINPTLSKLFLEYGLSEELFNKALSIYKLRKKQDNLPNIIIDGNDVSPICAGYYLVKLPIDDARAFVLGDITKCCQSIGDISESVVIDGVTLQNNGFYVMLKKRDNLHGMICTLPLINGKINDDAFELIGQGYFWISRNNEVVCDSWEDPVFQREAINVQMLTAFARHLCDADNSSYMRVAIGVGQYSRTPYEFKNRIRTTPEQMLEGVQCQDSSEQVNICVTTNLRKIKNHVFARLKEATHDDINLQSPFVAWIYCLVLSSNNHKAFVRALNQSNLETLEVCFNGIVKHNKVDLNDADAKLINGNNSADAFNKLSYVLPRLKQANIPLDMEIAEAPIFKLDKGLGGDSGSIVTNNIRKSATIRSWLEGFIYYERSEWKRMPELRSLFLKSPYIFSLMFAERLLPIIVKIKKMMLNDEVEIINTLLQHPQLFIDIIHILELIKKYGLPDTDYMKSILGRLPHLKDPKSAVERLCLQLQKTQVKQKLQKPTECVGLLRIQEESFKDNNAVLAIKKQSVSKYGLFAEKSERVGLHAFLDNQPGLLYRNS